METSAGEKDCAATGHPNNEGRKEKEENGDAIPSIFQYLYSLMDCLYLTGKCLFTVPVFRLRSKCFSTSRASGR